jgi:TolB protein
LKVGHRFRRSFVYPMFIVLAGIVAFFSARVGSEINIDLTKQWIVFHCVEDGLDPAASIYISDTTGGNIQRIIGSNTNILQGRNIAKFQPSWSPQNGLLTLIYNRMLAVSRINGTGLATVRDDASYSDPSWSPDGEWIVFTSNRGGFASEWNIFKLNYRTNEIVQLTFNGSSWRSSWSPNNDLIAFAFDQSIYLMETDGGNQRELMKTNLQNSQSTWSPDGRWLAFIYREDDSDALYKLNLDTQEMQRVTPNLPLSASPAWSPDGEWIAFSACSVAKISRNHKISGHERKTRE